MSALALSASVLRFVMLAVLTVSALVNPVLAIECEIREIPRSATGDPQPEATEVPSQDEDCCSVANCGSCCAHTVALQTPFDAAAAVPLTETVPPTLSVEFEPLAVPVALRPPIAT